jgi:multiple sugar transport system permease protein
MALATPHATEARSTVARPSARSSLGRLLGLIGLVVSLLVLALIFLLPFYVMVRNALMTQPEITSFEWKWFSSDPQWRNFKRVFTETEGGSMATGLRNSAIIAVVTVVLQMLIASMAGYALARIPARGKGVVFGLLLSTLMIPGAATFVPTYAVIAELGGVGTLWGIIVPGLFSVFSVFLFRQFFLEFPVELEEAARLDGAGYFRIYWSIIMPNATGILMALGALAFVGSWNGFLWPLVVGQTASSYTVQVVLSKYLTAQVIDLPMLFAAALVGIAPLVIVFLIMQRYIVQGVRLSGIKG